MLALASLVCIWGALFAFTWAHWGELSVDCGREMYASAELAQGKTLYSEVWYPYTPGAPYLNSLLFRAFGFQLSVLYWAGGLSALGSAIFLFLTGLNFVSRLAAWTTGAAILLQAFVPGIFSFPLPYSFGAVYGCLSACLCLWLMVNAVSSPRAWWMFGAGLAASAALLMKQEMGAACFAVIALLAIIRGFQHPTLRGIAFDAAALMPGLLFSGAVIIWMISLRGVEFLTQENLMSWPTSYFMKRYGALWLANTGLSISWPVVLNRGVAVLLMLAVFWLSIRWIAARFGDRPWLLWAGILALAAFLGIGIRWPLTARVARWLFFPPASPFLAGLMIPVVVWLWWRSRFSAHLLQILVLFALAFSISARILLKMDASLYAIYYDGPVLLAFFVILSRVLEVKAPGPAILPYLATLATVFLMVLPLYKAGRSDVPFPSERGVIYTTAEKSRAYRSALDFMRQHPQASFLALPEEMSLYFLADTHCPLRVYQFVPGVLVPGRMTDQAIQDIDRQKVRYLIWSNRTFEEYGAPVFGVDFDQALGQYLTSAYRPIRTIGDGVNGGWKAVVWERVALN